MIDYEKKLVLIAGSQYAGEIKKSVFSVMNYLMPKEGVFPMHCSANIGKDGDSAIFFGLSGTGKTTLSADPNRKLIGDDEHGWADESVFNFEGGCYAKCIDLTEESEPEIYCAIRFGALVENVIVDPETRRPDYADSSLTENTRVGYPVDYIPNAAIPGVCATPKTVIFLTADAYGVLPPISRWMKSRLCTISYPALPPSWPVRSGASPLPFPRSLPASARPLCRLTPPCMRRCWRKRWQSPARRSIW